MHPIDIVVACFGRYYDFFPYRDVFSLVVSRPDDFMLWRGFWTHEVYLLASFAPF